MLCAYCGKTANYTLKNGKYCCSPSSNQCEAVRAKNAAGLRKAHADGRMPYEQLISGHGWSKGKTPLSDPRVTTSKKLFEEASTASTGYIKEIILKENILPYRCEKCGNDGTWCSEPINLELDHKNGNNRDNRLENLRFLCPNCHSQTPTFKGRNKNRNKQRVSDEELLLALNGTDSIRQALQSVGLTGAGNYGRAYRLLAKELTPEVD